VTGRRIVLSFAIAASLVCGGGTVSAQDLRPARFCGACHGAIRREWETSAMAKSWKNPVFQAFLADAKGALGDTVVASCVACHAPAAAVTADYKAESNVSQEGVTCNFCHNVSAVDPSPKPASYTFDAGNPLLMRGPYKDSDPGSAHGFAYSEIHTKGEFCAACHEYASPASGVTIEATYSRWKQSPAAAKGKQCQDCHMPPYAGQAAPKISKMNRDKVHSHSFKAAHTPGLLDSVATLQALVEAKRLKLIVTNHRAGHSLPGGGGGMRVIILSVTFRGAAGESLSSAEAATYGIRYADAQGKSPVPKWLARKIVSQDEITSASTEIAWCDIPPKAKRADARLVYYFIDPAYVPSLKKRGVDLGAHQPVVMARASAKVP
jgi:nitrate/TMAO reductase-like tetraheme cytochrome c subunit